MANAGPNTNNSQFFITTVPCSHLDGINIAFGKVRKGFSVVQEIANVSSEKDKPLVVCCIRRQYYLLYKIIIHEFHIRGVEILRALRIRLIK